jgi:hypothetical protein
MSGKHPEKIFTDQCAAIINAIGIWPVEYGAHVLNLHGRI